MERFNNIAIFVYSIGLAIFLTGLNIMVDFTPQEVKAPVGSVLIVMGGILLGLSLSMFLHRKNMDKIEKKK